jgi:hypothetical protein
MIHQERKIVLYNMAEIVIPFTKHWVVLYTCLPNYFLILIPFIKGFLNPIEHFISLFVEPRILTSNVFEILKRLLNESISLEVIVTVYWPIAKITAQ